RTTERRRDVHGRDGETALRCDDRDRVVQRRADPTITGLLHDAGRDEEGALTDLRVEDPLDELALLRRVTETRPERQLELRIARDDAGEREQLTLDVRAVALGDGADGDLLDAGDEVRRRRPPLFGDRLEDPLRGGRERSEDRTHERRPCIGGSSVIG